jgi:SAM-dependent methyltransferase
MSTSDAANAKEIAYWNGPAGQNWTLRQEFQDVVFIPITAVVLARADVRSGERVLDVGCGTGETTIQLGERVGRSGRVLGIDVSEPMLARAQKRITADRPVEFLRADAAAHRFAPDEFDVLFSRFGVMFFTDPTLAFTNLRTGLRPGARVVFVCWRKASENPWLMTPLQAAYQHVPPMPKVGPEDPGAFSFASEERVRRVLGGAGFGSINLEPVDVELDTSGGQGLDEAINSALAIGPTSRAIDGQPADTVQRVTDSIRAALTPCVRGNRVMLPAGVWIVTAVNP